LHGYDVVTSDDHKIGTVVDVRDECLIVEHGHVFKSKHAIPQTFVSVDDDARIVHAMVTKDVFTGGPKVTDEWSCDAVLQHYGLVGGFEEPDTEGYGETLRTDPAEAAEPVGARLGVTPPEQERAEMREGTGHDDTQPAVRERQANAADPSGVSANLGPGPARRP
jgi:hypothetical protein